MGKLKSKLGQISLPFLGVATTVLVTMFGLTWNQISNNSQSVARNREMTTQTMERTATLEEAITTLKEDNRQIKADLKEILKLVK